ncbi:ABC transporter permease subunit [Anaerorhabdus sp.]|uniref:ABC transporter permease subunit n=1 Tax=Anaerorhabdus sp. TaxID=1872524 RepID=UPI002FCB87DC
MNIYLFELEKQWKSVLLWTASFVILMIALFAGVYPVFNNSLKDIIEVISKMPPEFTKAFAFDLNTMVDFGGFFEFSFAYLSLMGVIMSASIGLSIFAREKKVKCIDFLLTKPISRNSIFISKFLSGCTLLILFNLVYIIVSCFYGIHFGKTMMEMLGASSMMFLTQFFFYTLGICMAIVMKRIRSVSNIASLLGFVGFILSAVYNILEIKEMRYLAPLKYFDPMQFFTSTNDSIYMLTGIVVSILFLIVAYIRFIKEDVKAV